MAPSSVFRPIFKVRRPSQLSYPSSLTTFLNDSAETNPVVLEPGPLAKCWMTSCPPVYLQARPQLVHVSLCVARAEHSGQAWVTSGHTCTVLVYTALATSTQSFNTEICAKFNFSTLLPFNHQRQCNDQEMMKVSTWKFGTRVKSGAKSGIHLL